MSRFFPHSELEEDQPYSTAILTTHVLHRGFTAGALGGALASPAILLYRRRQFAQAQAAAAATASAATAPAAGSATAAAASSLAARPALAPILLRSSGVGALVGVALLTVGLQQRMKGREEIEWKDRSWRLMEHSRQLLVDDFSIAGAAAGLASGFRAGALDVGWRGGVGRLGLGSLAGTAAYLVFQYGLRPVFSDKRKEA